MESRDDPAALLRTRIQLEGYELMANPLVLAKQPAVLVLLAAASSCGSGWVAVGVYCYYKQLMVSWDETKRLSNLQDHGLDFVGADAIWDGFTVTREDIRANYGEARFVTFGVLEGVVVVLVHTDRDGQMHVISLRKAEPYEARYYLEAAKAYFDKCRGP